MTTTPTPPPEPGKELTVEFKNKDAAEPAPVTGTPRTPPETSLDKMQGWWRVQSVHIHQQLSEAVEYIRTLETEVVKGAEIKEQLYKSLGVVREERQYLQNELAAANLHGKTCVHHTDAERAEITCPVCLKAERDAIRQHMALARKEAECPDDDTLVIHCQQLRATLATVTAERDREREQFASAFSQSENLRADACKEWRASNEVAAQLRAANASLEADLITILTDVNYVGGVQHWIAKHAELATVNLDLATKLAALTKERDEALTYQQENWNIIVSLRKQILELETDAIGADETIALQHRLMQSGEQRGEEKARAALARLVTAADGMEKALIKHARRSSEDYDLSEDTKSALSEYDRAKQEAGV